MRQVARAEPAAAPGEVVMSPEAAAALEATDERTRVAADGLLERPFSGDDADLARFGAGSEAPGLAAVAAELLPDNLLDASAARCTSEAVRRDADRATRLLAHARPRGKLFWFQRHEDGSRRRRGSDADVPWRRVAATPRGASWRESEGLSSGAEHRRRTFRRRIAATPRP